MNPMNPMNPTNPMTVAVRAGWQRGLIELRQSFTNGQDLFGHVFWPAVMVVVLFILRDKTLEPSGLRLGTLVLPSVLGTFVALGGLLATSQLLTIEREDGTLLRAKATPHGMVGYLVGKIITVSGGTIAELVILLVPGAVIVSDLALGEPGSWVTLTWVLLLGAVATLPLGAVLGSVVTSPRSLTLFLFPMVGMIAISGIFYPITSLPAWLQTVAQVFPFYWLGLGMRSALLPDAAVIVELGQSWRPVETVAVLGAWAALGLVAAPFVLRRMARRESGSSVAVRRDKAMQRVG